MKVSDNPGYEIALKIDNIKVPVTLLKNKIEAFEQILNAKEILPGDKVLICINNEIELLSISWVLSKHHIISIPVRPQDLNICLPDAAVLYQAKYIITDSGSLNNQLTLDIIPVNKTVQDNHTYKCENSAEREVLILFDPSKDHKTAFRLTQISIQTFFTNLDGILLTESCSSFFISRHVPYHLMILELIWGLTRGVTTIIGLAENELTKIKNPDMQFKMDFSMLYFGSYEERNDEKNKYQLFFDTVKFADENGFKAVWTPERHFNEFGGLYPNPSVLSAAIAASTSNVQIRTGSLVSPLHHPIRIAEDWSLIDNLSNGRVGISFASGWQCDDFVFAPENYPIRHQYMLDQIETVKKLWAGNKVTFKNGLDKNVDVEIFPKPVQAELPIWITVSGKLETFIDAGKIGANILSHLLWQDTDELVGKIAAYRSSLKENGFDPYSRKVTIMVHTHLGQNTEIVKEKVREPLKTYIRSSTQLIQAMVKSNSELSDYKEVGGRYGGVTDVIPEKLLDELTELAFGRFFDHAGLFGTVEQAKVMVKKLKDYDVDELACLIDFGLSQEDVTRGLIFLNELRMCYDEHLYDEIPAKLMHCTITELESAFSNINIAYSFDRQTIFLLESEYPESIPDNIRAEVKIIEIKAGIDNHISLNVQGVKNTNSMQFLFNDSVSSDF